MKLASSLVLIALVLLGAGLARLGASPALDMAAAARAFLDALAPGQRALAQLAFDGPERRDWHYIPRQRPGLALRDMNDPQRAAARDLLRSALSSRGVLKVEAIMALDAILRDMEIAGGGTGATRDPLAYHLAIFGAPPDPSPGLAASSDGLMQSWGWKVEGHHISLNFTITPDGVSATPAFLGSNPALVRQGPQAGLRVLAAEEDLGRALLVSLDESQRAGATIPAEAPPDILTSPGRPLLPPDIDPAIGLPVSKMTPAQRALVERIVDEFAHNLRRELADAALERIRHAGIDNIRFAWIGAAEPGRPHYYRLVGPTFIFEYDNTQNQANHVHTVWHDRERDFGDPLREHIEREHSGR